MSEIEWEPCLLTQHPAPELEKRFEKETGRPGQLMRYFGDSQWLGDTMLRISVQVTTVVRINPDIVDQAGLAVSQDNSCRFCFGVQRAFLRVLGMSEKRINRLEQDLLTDDFSQSERAALDFARRISKSKPLVDRNDFAPLYAAGYSHPQCMELAGLVAVHLFLNRVSTFVALPPKRLERMPDTWLVRLLRPLLAIKFRHMRHQAQETQLLPHERTGEFAAVINALDGLPMAREFRTIVDDMWRLQTLPPRTVSVLFAIIARALGSQYGESQARASLRKHGFVDDDIDQVLTHLSSPVLTELEQVLAPMARETVWYQPAAIQRRCAELRAKISLEQFLDFCGVVSLLNSLCRLSVLSEMDE